ncbi:CRAL/TRIO domain-containing protein [Xylariaceae sp. AK1471]|nr:CRAL/TRIO domain-containing protein [Xylariaceae sp. AK1471]
MSEMEKNGQLNGSTSELAAHEKLCLESFIQQCRDRGLLERPTDLSPEDVLDGLNDEITLLRFLRGRSFDVAGAIKQFEEAQAIRLSVNAVAAYDSMDLGDFEQSRNMYPHWIGLRTKVGHPICVLDAAYLDHPTISTYSQQCTTSEATRRTLVCLDYLPRFVLPLYSAMSDRPDPDTPISSAVYLVDVETLSFKQAWSIRGYAQNVTKLLATCYPEVVDKIYVLNAAPYFAKIWSWLKGWIDPRTAAKIVIVSPADAFATLSEAMDIECIPERYGGKSRGDHGMRPSLDSGMKELLGVDELPDGPVKWIIGQQEKRTAVAVGTKDGEMRRELLTCNGVIAPNA